jgi:hypothetical protein
LLTQSKGGVVIGDQHFSKGRKLFKNVKFYTAYKRKPGDLLTAEQEKFNTQLYRVRARIEHPFSWIDRNFQSLEKPWRESETQMDLAVAFAGGLFNVLRA